MAEQPVEDVAQLLACGWELGEDAGESWWTLDLPDGSGWLLEWREGANALPGYNLSYGAVGTGEWSPVCAGYDSLEDWLRYVAGGPPRPLKEIRL